MRLLVLIIVIGLLIFFINSWIRMLKFKPPADTGKSADSEKMTQCKFCGSYIPESHATVYKDLHFCSGEHLRKYLSEDRDANGQG